MNRPRLFSIIFAITMVYGGADVFAGIWEWIERNSQPTLAGRRVRAASDG